MHFFIVFSYLLFNELGKHFLSHSVERDQSCSKFFYLPLITGNVNYVLIILIGSKKALNSFNVLPKAAYNVLKRLRCNSV